MESAGRLIGSRQDHSDHVEESCHDERLRCPEVKRADQPTEGDQEGERLHRSVGALGAGDVIEQLESPGQKQAEKKEYRKPAEAKRVAEAGLTERDRGRLQISGECVAS